MKRSVILCVLAVAALAAAPAFAAAPFGSFGGIVGGGNAGGGVLPLTGWALDDNGVQAVDILVDGFVSGRAMYGRARAGVTSQFPGYPDSALPGFGFMLDTTRYMPGLHTVTVRVKSRAGEVAFLAPRVIQFTNDQHNLGPFGAIDFPKPQAELRGNCDPASPNRRYTVITGYALDAGLTQDDAGVAWVELLIDRSLAVDPFDFIIYNSDLSCTFSAVKGGQTDCYGIRRLDIERVFPTLKDSPHAGFRFVLDVGHMLSAVSPLAEPQYTQGSHVLSIRVGDHSDQSRIIAEMPVTFTCDQNTFNEASFGDIDLPLRGLLYNGTITATGWALDWDGVSQVQILVDGRFQGVATYGIPRPDVAALSFYPGYLNIGAPGWQFPLNTRNFENGEHFLDVVVVDAHGVSTYIGKRRFVINNIPQP